MHAQRRFFLALVVLLLAAPAALGATPQRMLFNDAASADVKGQVQSLSIDGGGRWGAVGVGDAPPLSTGLTLTDEEMFVYNLRSESLSWKAKDHDSVQEGARLVAVANGTSATGGGDWILLVNNTVPGILTAYRSNGIGRGGAQNELTWQYNPNAGTIYGLDVNADARLVAVATGGAGFNKTITLLQNRQESQAPLVLFRYQLDATATNVTRYTSVALSVNSTIPDVITSTRAAYMVVGAETTSTEGLVQGSVRVYEIGWTGSDLQHPAVTKIFERETSSPVLRVAMSADGGYAAAGTQDGQVFLVTVKEALVRRGVAGAADLLTTSTQQSVGSEITSLAMSIDGGEVVAVGTTDGQIAMFQNRQDASRSEGAHLRDLARMRADTSACGFRGPVTSVRLSDRGDQLVAGVKNGLIAVDAGAFARYFGAQPAEPSWCVPLPESEGGVHVDISGDGRTIFAGTGNHVYGYKNFDKVTLAAADGQTRRASSPGARVQVPLTVSNDGSAFDVVNLTVTGPLDPGWEIEVSNRSLLLLPGKSQQVLLNVTSPPTLSPGNFTLAVRATPQRAGEAGEQTLNLRLDLGKLRRVEVRPPATTQVTSQGVENRIAITIHNGGNDVDRFRLTASIPEPQENFRSPGSDWAPRMEPVVVEVPPNSDAVAQLVVFPQGNRGDFATIQVVAEPDVLSPDEVAFGDAKQVTVAIEPSYGGSIDLVENKDYRVEAGQVLYVNYTVQNRGNTRDIFLIRNHTEPANAPGWRLQLSDERFELRTTNAQKVVRLSAVAQLGLQPGESVKIVLDLFSEGQQKTGSTGSVDSQSVTVTVIPKQRQGLPFAPEALIVVAVAALALTARRRGA